MSIKTIVRARTLRRDQTEAEKALWHEAKAKRFLGYKFRRQHPIGSYFVDFVCIEAELIVELDGRQHCENKTDNKRTEFLESKGFKVLRFWNNEVMSNMTGVLETLSLTLSQRERELRRKSAIQSPLPLAGEGQGEGL